MTTSTLKSAENQGAKAKRVEKTPVDCLRLHSPEGPWCLTAIIPDGGTETETFRASQKKAMEEWIAARNGKRNLYFHVNPVRTTLSKKARRENIRAVTHLHVDVDPEPGADLAEEQERILALFTTDLPKGIPEPTMLVFSGGGYQAFWKLEEPIIIDGDLGLAEDAKLYNVQMETFFGADNCHNIDRLMRIAGTMNIPDQKKIDKGRVPTRSAVMFHKPKNVYPISQFKKAAPSKDGMTSGYADHEVSISGNVEPILDIQFLRENPYNVSNTTVVAIAQGSDENNPKEGDNSRSAWVFHVACALVRAEVPDDMIFSILTDKGWGISESVLESKDPAKYAIRQIGRAKQYTEDPDLAAMNDQFCVLRAEGDKVRVLSFKTNELKHKVPVLQTRGDFENAWCNKMKEIPTGNGGVKFKPLGKWWFEHPKRRALDAMCFDPSTTDEVIDGKYLNLWKGFAVKAAQGDCSLFLDHLLQIVCGGNQSYFDYLISYLAYAVQHPEKPAEVALVLQGGRGAGKGFTLRSINQLFGAHAIQITNPKHLVGNFNEHLRDKCFVFFDESQTSSDKTTESILKALITEDTMMIEAKGLRAVQQPNRVTLVMATNDGWAVRAGSDERRYFILKLSDAKAQNHDYFTALKKELDGGGKEALLHHLLNIDLDGFHPRKNIPQTDALREQKLLSLPPVEQWIFNVLQEGVLDGATVKVRKKHEGKKTIASGDARCQTGVERFENDRDRPIFEVLPGIYSQVQKAPGCKDVHSREISKMMEAHGFDKHKAQDGRYYWVVPPLKQARMLWEKEHGETDWDRRITDWDDETRDDDAHTRVSWQDAQKEADL